MGARAGGGKEEQGQREVVSLVWNLLCSKRGGVADERSRLELGARDTATRAADAPTSGSDVGKGTCGCS